MNTKTNILVEDLDQEVVERLSRRDALGNFSTIGMGLALASVPGVFAALSQNAFAQGGLPQQIRDVLNFALTLEYLEAEFYTMGVNKSGLIPAANQAVFTTIRDHENAHVALLKSVLGSDAVAKPTFDFTAGGGLNPFGDFQQFLVLSQLFEDTGVRAYKGQAGNLMADNGVLTTALQIHSVEARHASEVRRIRGQKGWITQSQYDVAIPSMAGDGVYEGEGNLTQGGVNVTTITSVGPGAITEAFDEPLTKEQVLAIAAPFIK